MVNKKILSYIILGLLIVILLVLTIFPQVIYAVKDSTTGNSVEDTCNPPEGMTIKEWTTHMSHHPNIYSKCLE